VVASAVKRAMLRSARTKVLLVDREYHRVMTEALSIAKTQPLVVDIDDPDVGRIREVGPFVNMSQTPAVITHPAPRLGADTDAVFCHLPSEYRLRRDGHR